jgi:predicted nucleic acid-binding protein
LSLFIAHLLCIQDHENRFHADAAECDVRARNAHRHEQVAGLTFFLLMAQRFDLTRFEVTGELVRITEQVASSRNFPAFTASENGVLAMKQIRNSEAVRAAYGMMTNDSVTAAMMLNYGITNLASLDSDLSRVPGFTLYQPTDVA